MKEFSTHHDTLFKGLEGQCGNVVHAWVSEVSGGDGVHKDAAVTVCTILVDCCKSPMSANSADQSNTSSVLRILETSSWDENVRRRWLSLKSGIDDRVWAVNAAVPDWTRDVHVVLGTILAISDMGVPDTEHYCAYCERDDKSSDIMADNVCMNDEIQIHHHVVYSSRDVVQLLTRVMQQDGCQDGWIGVCCMDVCNGLARVVVAAAVSRQILHYFKTKTVFLNGARADIMEVE